MSSQWRASSPTPLPKPGITHVEIEGEQVLYDPATRAVARLDRVGALLWGALDGEGAVGDLAADTAAAFGIDAADALAGVLALLDDLEQAGFLAPERSA